MKKLLSLIITLCLAATVLIGCAGTPQNEEARGIASALVNENGELVITYTDGTEDNLGVIKGADGENGKDGKDGADGKDGSNGKDGKPGAIGPAGADGKDGVITVVPSDNSVVLATAKGLISSVSVIATFTKTTYTGTSEFGSAGSGVIYKLDRNAGDAYIITNYHVVYSAESNEGVSNNIEVYLYGSEYRELVISADYVGGSMKHDIAVLKVDNSEILRLSDAVPIVPNMDDVHVGDTAIAVGNPENMGTSASVGIISVDSEYITMTSADDLTEVSFRVMRIDTAVNSGNSGGGLFGTDGRLIGIVNAKVIDESVENIAYAIPSAIAIRIADSIIDFCDGESVTQPKRVLMGVLLELTDSRAEYDESTGKISVVETIKIAEVVEDSLSDGKLLAGDVVLSISNGEKTVEVTREFHLDFLLSMRPGDTIAVTVLRNNVETTVNITFTEDCLTDC